MRENIKKIITTVLKNNDNIYFAYLFGSFVKDNLRLGSDIDIAVFFKSDPRLEQISAMTLKLEEAVKAEIDLIQLNDLDKLNPVMAYSIVSSGIILVNNHPVLLNEFKNSSLLQYLDFKPTSDEINKSFEYRLSNNRYAVFDK